MPLGIKKPWTLTVTLNIGVSAPAVTGLEGGVLDVFGQHKTKETATFDMFVAQLRNGVDSGTQLVAGAIDNDNTLGFIFLSDPIPTGIQYIFKAGVVQPNGKKIDGGRIWGPLTPDNTDPTDIGSWSGTGGSGGDDDDEED
jgi:hypothetical protein